MPGEIDSSSETPGETDSFVLTPRDMDGMGRCKGVVRKEAVRIALRAR
jgi:hypothetical protein